MPGRALHSARLFDQKMVVKQAHCGALHQRAGGRSGGRLVDEPLVGIDALPVAKILEEAAWVAGLAGDDGAFAWAGQIGFDAAGQHLNFVGVEQAAHADRTALLVCLDDIGRDGAGHAVGQVGVRVKGCDGHAGNAGNARNFLRERLILAQKLGEHRCPLGHIDI